VGCREGIVEICCCVMLMNIGRIEGNVCGKMIELKGNLGSILC
jgi:hypothetical protein